MSIIKFEVGKKYKNEQNVHIQITNRTHKGIQYQILNPQILDTLKIQLNNNWGWAKGKIRKECETIRIKRKIIFNALEVYN